MLRDQGPGVVVDGVARAGVAEVVGKEVEARADDKAVIAKEDDDGIFGLGLLQGGELR
jgi:hypothetical protein